jgi:hypothetical protein
VNTLHTTISLIIIYSLYIILIIHFTIHTEASSIKHKYMKYHKFVITEGTL